MPFKSEAQRRKFYAMSNRGEISKDTVKEWESATPKDKKLPERVVKKAFDSGVSAAFALLGMKTAGEEIRMKIPSREFHGWDAAWRNAGRCEKKAEGNGPPAELLAEALNSLDETGQPVPVQAQQDPLDRQTLWGAPSNLAGGDTANRISDMGQNTNVGTVF